jgi:monothiol glutaredoxin
MLTKTRSIKKTSYWNYSSSASIQEKIADQVKKAPCVVYMKGTPDRPQCGFSKAVVDILNVHGMI